MGIRCEDSHWGQPDGAGAAEDLDLAAETFDAAICRMGLMPFLEPAQALDAVRHALRPEARCLSSGSGGFP